MPARLFPSSGKTPFREWVKAGALKQGDSVLTSASMVKTAIANGGEMLKAANDNGSLTVAEIVRGNRTARVYNFEVESRAGEITNNYLVGDAQAWVHNANRYFQGKLRKEVMQRGGFKCVRCGASENLQGDHIIPCSLGGETTLINGQPLCGSCNLKKYNRPPIKGLDLPWE